MQQAVTIRREGGELAVAIPNEMAEQMNVRDGDKLYLVQTDHGPALVAAGPVSGKADRAVLAAFDDVVRQYDSTLRRLAQ